MKSGSELETTCIAFAVLVGLGLMGLLTLYKYQPIPVERRDPLPGAGWGWSFDYALGMQGLGSEQASNSARRPVSRDEVLELILNKPLRTGAIEITYRGLVSRKRFQIDLVIPALDPQYSYSNEFSIADARKGFTLMDRRFKLLEAGRIVLRLQSDPSMSP